MTADQARAQTKGLNDKLNVYIGRIDQEILAKCERGGRFLKTSGAGVGYNSDIAQHYRDNGFQVSHYVSPRDELEIQW